MLRRAGSSPVVRTKIKEWFDTVETTYQAFFFAKIALLMYSHSLKAKQRINRKNVWKCIVNIHFSFEELFKIPILIYSFFRI